MRFLAVLLAAGAIWGQQNLFEPAETCKLCHNAPAIGQYGLWSGSMMAHSAKDPYWKAKVKFETETTPAARAAIEDKCLRCHAPIQQYPLRAKNQPLALAKLDETGVEGVSCTVCHKIEPTGLGKPESFTGGFRINKENEIYGPHEKPFPMPMLHHSGQFPTVGKQILDSALCATCHTVITPTLDAAGKQVGEFVEQAPYLEWLASDFAKSNVTCQSCHVPTLKDAAGAETENYIAHTPHGPNTRFPPTSPRKPFGRHVFLGGNVQMLRLLGSPSAARTEEFVRTAAGLDVAGRLAANTLELTVDVTNKTGHKLPTGFPGRRLWLYVRVTGADGKPVFESGAWDPATGELKAPARQPHRDRIASPAEVAVYETEMATPDGQPTLSLLRAARYAKDNRLLPQGFRPNPQIAPAGVSSDPDFLPGTDRVKYAVPVPRPGPYTVRVQALYQSVPPSHAAPLDPAFRQQLAPHRAPVLLQEKSITIR